MINMSHNCYNGWPWLLFLRIIFDFFFFFRSILKAYKLYFITKLPGNQFYNFRIKPLVDRYHYAKAHAFADNISKIHIICNVLSYMESR